MYLHHLALFPDHRSGLVIYVSSSCHFHCHKVLQYQSNFKTSHDNSKNSLTCNLYVCNNVIGSRKISIQIGHSMQCSYHLKFMCTVNERLWSSQDMYVIVARLSLSPSKCMAPTSCPVLADGIYQKKVGAYVEKIRFCCIMKSNC